MYRLSVINSWGRLPQGIYSGNKIDYGYYDQCLRSHPNTFKTKSDIKPQYCLLPLQGRLHNQTIGFQIGVCVPDTCSTVQVQTIMNVLLNKIGYESSAKMDPCIDTTPERFGTLEKVTIGAVIGLLVIIGISTIYDVVQKYRKGKKS